MLILHVTSHAKNHTATLSSFDAPCLANSANPVDSGL